MKYYIITLALLCVYCIWYTYSGSNLISAKVAKLLINSGNVQIVDVRSRAEYITGHYPTAIHLPITIINKETLSTLDENKITIVYCNTGQRARRAAELMTRHGFQNVYYIASSYKQLITKQLI